jgi:hypothetical protein
VVRKRRLLGILYITPSLLPKTKNASTALRVAHQCMAIYRVDVLSIKKGIPLYPNLVNLKSNTMKNTMQRYGVLRKMQCFDHKKVSEIVFFKDLSVILQSVVGK